MKSQSKLFVLCVLATVLALSLAGFSQSDRASIVGRTADTTGAVIQGATVKITDPATNFSVTLTTDNDGRYVSGSVLKAGKYTVEATKTGFKKAVVKDVVLGVGDVREINLSLSAGAANEVVEVTASAVALETETSSRGDVITGRQVVELPLKDRNFTQLATLSPGVTRSTGTILTDAQYFNQGDANAGNVPGGSNERGSTESARFSRSGGASISANGLRPTNNNFSLDGVDNNEPQFGTIGVFPNPDAIGEFQIQTSVAKADTGRGGASINTIYKSGTNQFHGSGYYYGQNDGLNATHAQIGRNRAQEIASGATAAQAEKDNPKSKIQVNEFGATVGGPIWKDKTFFFFDYLGQRNDIPNNFKTVVPTAKSRIGDFSEFANPVRDPVTGLPFPGNIIPNLQTRPDFSPQGFKLFAAYPLPTVNVMNPSNGGSENYFGVRKNSERINSFDVKIDQRFGEKNTLAGRFSYSNQERDRANFYPKVPTAGFGAGNEVGNTRQVAISDTHTFKSTLMNEFKFGWTQVEIGILNCGVGGACGVSPTFCNDIGIPNCNKGTLATSGGILTGGFGNGFFEFTGDGGLFQVKSNNFYIADSVTWVNGKHTWKGGFEIRPRHLDTIDGGRSGGLKGALNYGDSNTGNAQADILLSTSAPQASSGSILGGARPYNLKTTEWGIFVQDDWKATSQLTFNFGVRYDVFPGYHEDHGRLATWDPVTQTINKAKGSGDSLVNTDLNNGGVRIGAAYSFGNERQFVFRGGYGRFFTQDGVDYPPLIRNAPFTTSVNFDAFAGTGGAFSLKTGPPVASNVDPPVIVSSLKVFTQEKTQRTGSIDQWNLTWQWQFAKNYLLDLGYVGTRSTDLLATRQIGNADNGLGFAKTPANLASCPAFPAPCYISFAEAYENRTSEQYHGLQAKFEKRLSHGLQMTTAYTWSHNIDDSPGSFQAPGDQRNQVVGPINPFDFRKDRGNSSLDHRHVFVQNMIYDLPFGRGKKYGSGVGRAADVFIGGWQTNVILSGQTGQAFSIGSQAPSGESTVAVITGDPFANLAPHTYLNKAAFSNPAATSGGGTTCITNLAGKNICYGNSARNQFYGPGYFHADMSLFKNIAFNERWKAQLGIEFFNIANSNDGVIPSNYIGNGDFGKFNNSLPPRTVQYRFKVMF